MYLYRTVLSISSILILSIVHQVSAQDCGCTHTIEPSNVTDGEEEEFSPGDVICVKGGTYGPLFWKNINGTEDNPIIIKNCDGQVVMSGSSYGWKWHTSKHFRILGNGDEDYSYGFKISTESSFYMPMEYFTTNFEIAYVEIVGEEEEGGDIYAGFAGLGLKTSPYQDCDLFQEKDAWTMEDISVHDNYIHQVGGEGIYAGHGFHQGREEGSCDDGVFTYPHAIHNLEVYNNRIEDVGFDGIQIKNATQNTSVHDNTIYNYGLRDEGAHNEGLFIGESTEGTFYNNKIEKGTGHGIQINAYGDSKFYNNLVIDCEDNGVYLNNQSDSFENKEGTFEFFHNTLVNMGKDAFEAFTPQKIIFKNNMFVNYGGDKYAGNDPDVEGDIYADDVNAIGFVDPEIGNYYLTETSTAVDAGVYIASLNYDINNTPRNDDTPDVGAYEFSLLSLSLTLNTDEQLDEGEGLTVDAVLIDENNLTEKIQYVLNGSIIGTYILPSTTEHTIEANELNFGNNEFHAEALTVDEEIYATNPINIQVVPSISANAGKDVVFLNTYDLSIELNGTESQGEINSYTWSLVSVDPSSNLTPLIDDENDVVAEISGLAVGTYTYELKVAYLDNIGDTLTNEVDSVLVTINELATVKVLLDVTKNQKQPILKQVEVYNMAGVHLKTIKINGKTLELDQLKMNSGLYVLKSTYQNGSTRVKKVLIDK